MMFRKDVQEVVASSTITRVRNTYEKQVRTGKISEEKFDDMHGKAFLFNSLFSTFKQKNNYNNLLRGLGEFKQRKKQRSL